MRGPIDACGPIFSSSEASARVMSSISLIISDSLFEQSHFMKKNGSCRTGHIQCQTSIGPEFTETRRLIGIEV